MAILKNGRNKREQGARETCWGKKEDVQISLDRWEIRGWNVFLEKPEIVSTEIPFRGRVFHADCYKSWKDRVTGFPLKRRYD